MKDYDIEIEEVLRKTVRIRSKNIDDAFSKAEGLYKKEKIVLDYNDLAEVRYSNLYSKKLEESLEIKMDYNSITGNLTIKIGENPEEIYSVDTVNNLSSCLSLYIADHIEEHDIDSKKGHQLNVELDYIDEDYDMALEEY